MQKGRSDLRKRGCGSRPCSRASRGKGERSRALLGGLLVMFLLVGVVGWPDCSPAVDGTLQWAYPTGGNVYSSPALASDGTIYVGSNDTKLYAINANGTLKWAYTTGGSVSSSPALASNGTIYVGSGNGKLYAINANGTLQWAYTTGGEVRSSPAIAANGTIYVGSGDGKLYALYGPSKLANTPWPMFHHDRKHTGRQP